MSVGAVRERSADLPESAYRSMALVLRVGLATALVLLVGALAAYLAEAPSRGWSAGMVNPSLDYLSLPGLVGGLAAGSPIAILTLGVFALVATPVLRVLSGLYFFERNGERSLAALVTTVFLLLLFGLFVLGPLVR